PAVQRVAVGGLLRWLGTTHDVPLRGETFHGPGKFTLASESSPIRLAGADWLRFGGVLGHQHVPENSHWDPGGIDLAAIVGGTKPDDMEGEHMGPGDKGPKVKHWQRRMIALGYARRDDGSTVTEWNDKWADADYGPATTAATKRLQDTVGYRPTGEVDADLRDRMVEAFTDQRDTNARQALAARLVRRIGDASGMEPAKVRQLIDDAADEAAREAVSAALKDEYAVTIQRRVL
ncbi:MAG: peptidoglycan-binding protein, partial [Actinomycetota bacterium]|nr:peptidoglycan-binding protein [Actinomycetota bacterium]